LVKNHPERVAGLRSPSQGNRIDIESLLASDSNRITIQNLLNTLDRAPLQGRGDILGPAQGRAAAKSPSPSRSQGRVAARSRSPAQGRAAAKSPSPSPSQGRVAARSRSPSQERAAARSRSPSRSQGRVAARSRSPSQGRAAARSKRASSVLSAASKIKNWNKQIQKNNQMRNLKARREAKKFIEENNRAPTYREVLQDRNHLKFKLDIPSPS